MFRSVLPGAIQCDVASSAICFTVSSVLAPGSQSGTQLREVRLSAPGCPSGEGKELGEQEGHFPPEDVASVALAQAGCSQTGAGD